MKVLINGLVTNYQKTGVGPLILLLHGWGDNLKTFDNLVKDLENTFTVIRLDLPGFGSSDMPKEAFNLGLYARFVSEFLAKTESNELYAVVGHSNGAAIAIKALSENIFSAKKLVLLASSGVRKKHSPSKKVFRIGAKTLKYPTKILPVSMQNKIKKSVYQKIGSDLFVAEALQDTFKKIITEDITDEAAKITAKTLIIYGQNDSATPVEYGEIFHKNIVNSGFKIIEGAEHFLHHTHQTEVNNAIKMFLDMK